MPLYEYACGSCGARFERIRKFSDPPVTTCPECGGTVEKLISSPAFHLKGSGWYITDYARSGQKEGGKEAAGKEGASKDGSAKEIGKDASDKGSSEKSGSGTDSGATSASSDSSTATKSEAPKSESSAPAKPATSDSKR